MTRGVNPHSSPPPPAPSPVPDPDFEGETAPPDPPGQARDDAELLQAHIDGDPKAFATLVRRHQEEAATILGCAPGTVKSRCARGRARLAPFLAALREAERGV